MVTATPALEVRTVTADQFDDIYPLLQDFQNVKMSRTDWYQMLFGYPWYSGADRGFALYADGEAVGFLGTIFSERTILGRPQIVCNTSSWIVREAYRSASIMLLKPLLSLRNCTIVNLTPTARSYEIFQRLGFTPLESERLLLLPFGSVGGIRGSWETVTAERRMQLSPDDRRISEQLASSENVVQLILRRGEESCLIIATPLRVKRVPFAEIHYISNPEFFWRHRLLAHRAVTFEMRAAGIALDRRHSGGRATPLSIARPVRRLFRPADRETPAAAVDGLFSELMLLKI